MYRYTQQSVPERVPIPIELKCDYSNAKNALKQNSSAIKSGQILLRGDVE